MSLGGNQPKIKQTTTARTTSSNDSDDIITQSTPLLDSSSSGSSSTADSEVDFSPESSGRRSDLPITCAGLKITWKNILDPNNNNNNNNTNYKLLEVITGHVGSVSCLALCGEFVLSASQGRDIILWQQPNLRQYARFGQGDGSVKALATFGNRVFSAHQDSLIRVWKISARSENVFSLVNTLPTTKDYLGKFMKQSNYVQTRRHHKKLWIEHADSISCLAVSGGFLYSGSWDKTIKVWRLSDFKCLESIKAHDDAINGLQASKKQGLIFSASADGKIKAWANHNRKKQKWEEEGGGTSSSHSLKWILEGGAYDDGVSMNCLLVWDQEREDGDDAIVVYGGGSDGYVMCWRMEKDKGEDWRSSSRKIRAHEMAVLCMCMCVKGEIMCSGSADKSIGIWRMKNRGGRADLERLWVITGHQGPVKCIQASPVSIVLSHGFLLYSGSLDKSIRIWWVPFYSQTTQYLLSSD